LVHRTNDPVVNVEGGRQLANNIPEARLLELPGINHFPFLGDDCDEVTNEVAEYLTGAKPPVRDERILANGPSNRYREFDKTGGSYW
jgi:hypothetical protein